MHKLLVLPDLHTKTEWADKVIEKENPSEILVLGDVFHEWNDDSNVNERVAHWLKPRLHDPRYTFLWGNHDLCHGFPGPHTQCPGYTEAKNIRINEILTRDDWKQFKFFYFLRYDILATHAGLTRALLMGRDWVRCSTDFSNLRNWLLEEEERAYWCLGKGKLHWFYTWGMARGGYRGATGGLVWCDYHREFQPILNLNQVFGHTYIKTPELVKCDKLQCWTLNLDSDTRHYAIFENDKISVYPFDFSHSNDSPKT